MLKLVITVATKVMQATTLVAVFHDDAAQCSSAKQQLFHDKFDKVNQLDLMPY